jgi:hypothetical protein
MVSISQSIKVIVAAIDMHFRKHIPSCTLIVACSITGHSVAGKGVGCGIT